MDIKDSVRVASTVNVPVLTGIVNLSVIDGVTVSTGDRVLLKNQTAPAENGIWVVVASGAASRSIDSDSSSKVTSGLYVFVSEGAQNGGTGFVLTTSDPVILNTTPLVFTAFSGAGQVIAGNGLSESGNTLSINTGVTVDLSTAQTLTNKSISGAQITSAVANATLAATVTTNANLTGDVTSVGNSTTLTNAPVIAKVLTGYTSGAGTVAATDTILQAFQKVNGNDVLRETSSNKDASGGYAGLTLLKLNLKNAANTITSFFTTAATVARTWTMPDKDGTVAMTSDITGTNSGTNTGDQTTITGNAGTATALQTARTIGGTSFDGTANISISTVAATALTGTIDSARVSGAYSGITALGTLTALSVNGALGITASEEYIYLYSTYTIGSNSRVRMRAVGAGGGSGYGGDFRLSTRNSSNVWNNDAFVIDSAGRVGIGASPTEPLHVVGNIRLGTVTDMIFLNNIAQISSSAPMSIYSNSETIFKDTSEVEFLRITRAGTVGIGTASPNANAILDVTSTTKAFMPPRMTTTQKNAIASPTAGMMVYDSTLNKLSLYTTAWETVTSV